ncbi:MAG: hypothetical protein HC897_15445 [Thermoanaerobaculia bacterium]|nr:hypothetical protein [Thermoanaerobaculia bacterium]
MDTRISRLLMAAALVSALVLTIAPAAHAGKGELIFKIDDPRGDDHGDGHLLYPTRTELGPGDLDLLAFTARRVEGGTQFEAELANPIRVATREAIDGLGTSLSSVARYGFYTFNIDVYVDMDHVPGSGGISTLPGRKAVIASENAWDRAIVLTPRPHEARTALADMMLKALNKELRAGEYGQEEVEGEARALKQRLPDDLERRIFFPNQIRVRANKVSFFVPDSFFGKPVEATWSYVVVVSGADLIQSLDISAAFGLADTRQDHLMLLPISPGSWKDRFGGGREYDEVLQPPLVDIVVPEGQRQERVLSDFSSRDERPVVLRGVVPAQKPVVQKGTAVEKGPALGVGR